MALVAIVTISVARKKPTRKPHSVKNPLYEASETATVHTQNSETYRIFRDGMTYAVPVVEEAPLQTNEYVVIGSNTAPGSRSGEVSAGREQYSLFQNGVVYTVPTAVSLGGAMQDEYCEIAADESPSEQYSLFQNGVEYSIPTAESNSGIEQDNYEDVADKDLVHGTDGTVPVAPETPVEQGTDSDYEQMRGVSTVVSVGLDTDRYVGSTALPTPHTSDADC